ncbi:MAG: hypothetical protein LBN18_08565 [Dysgonamonadaceae bacterium]|jgi:hypothetical protein|nr:hypothetical protein [Dysgonamonadaceae bacterium]
MSIQIIKKLTGEFFDLPTDYVIEVEKNNPVFERKGSQTVTINFPVSDRNRRLFNFPYRLDKSNREENTIDVIIRTGSIQQRGLLSVIPANNRSIAANIGYDESEMYSVMENMQLRDLPNLPQFTLTGDNMISKIDSMLTHLTAVMNEQLQADYYVFPIWINLQDEYRLGLNEIVDYPSTDPNLGKLRAWNSRTILQKSGSDNIEINVPKGYGVSPFLKVYRILELIFDYFGFTVAEDPFKTHRQLSKLVVLNNTIDAILTGSLYYRDMMPDVSIQSFLDTLYAKFGLVYFIDSNSRSVRFKFVKDLVATNTIGAIDMNKFKTEEPSITSSSPRQLRLKMNREMEGTAVLGDTYAKFLDKFAGQFTELDTGNATQKFYPAYSIYKILNIFRLNSGILDQSVYTSSAFFDWDQQTPGVEYEDVSMDDLCLPFYGYDMINALQYGVRAKHIYSELIVSGQTQENSSDTAKLAFAFAWGMQEYKNNGFNYFFASQINRDANGNYMYDANNQKYDIALTCIREDGLYNRFWKEYDAFIRHSNQEVTGRFKISDLEILNLKMYDRAVINNQPVLLKQIKYTLNQPNSIAEIVFRTLRLYKPYNLSIEQSTPNYANQIYYWAANINETLPDSQITAQSDFYAWKKINISSDVYMTVNGVQTPIIHLSYLPPTQQQYESNEQRIYTYKKTYYYYVQISIGGIGNDQSVIVEKSAESIVTITYSPAIINYD